MCKKSRFQQEDKTSETSNLEGGERCTFSSWKYSPYFELLKKKKHTHKCLIKGPAQPGLRSGSGRESKLKLVPMPRSRRDRSNIVF